MPAGLCASGDLSFADCATSLAVVTLKTSSTVVIPMRDEAPAVFGQRAHARACARRRESGRSRRFSKSTGGFHCRCPSTRKSRAGQKNRCCGIRGSRRIGKSWCSRECRACALNACAVGESSGLLAMRTKHAHEALREHGFERRGDQIRLDAHVHQARQRAGRVVRVQRGENQMAGERRLHGDLRRLLRREFRR